MAIVAATHESSSPEQTEALGADLVRALRAGDVVLLFGEMGAGKTTLVRGALRALGHAGPVTSPTYTLARHYETSGVAVSHLDLHRLGDLEDEDPGFLADHVHAGAIAFVEWPEAAAGDPDLDVRVAARVRLEHVDASRRRVTVGP